MQNIICNNCGFNNQNTSRFCSRCGHELPKPAIEVQSEPVQKPSRKNTTIKVIVGSVVWLAAVFGIMYVKFKKPSDSYDKAMMGIAEQINKSCPIMIDKETQLNNTFAMPGNVFQYNYTLVNMDRLTTDTIDIKSYLEPIIINNVKSNPDLKPQREHRTSFYYYYKDKNSNYFFSILVTPDMYE